MSGPHLLTLNEGGVDYKVVTECRVCKGTNLKTYLDLGNAPLPNNLLGASTEIHRVYPLRVLFCQDCCLSQLSVVVNPKLMFDQYAYHSSVSQTFKDHCATMAQDLMDIWKKKESPTKRVMPMVMDIASNDGCLLREFRKEGFTVNGVEPAKNHMLPFEDLIPVIHEYWSESLANAYTINADFITATNVFAHVDDLDDFLRGVKKALRPDGVFVVEVPYLQDLMLGNQYDTIYHEHLSYFLLTPLKHLFDLHSLPIFRVERQKIHGGSLRIYAAKAGVHEVEPSVEQLLNHERLMGYTKFNHYQVFKKNVEQERRDLQKMLMGLVGKKVMGYGASAKGASLLNYCGITPFQIQSIVDDTPDKQGKFVPGCGIPIVDFSHFEKERPDYIVLLAWNFADELIKKTKHLGAKYIIPIPWVRVI